jgi:vacuolar-type H+-ATPase subunit F/Vma7
MSDKIKGCVIGEKDIIRIFEAFSFDVKPVNQVEEFNEVLTQIILSNLYRMIIITETYISSISIENEFLIKEKKQIVLSIPTNQGSRTDAVRSLSNLIRRAVGIDLLTLEGDKQA